jgi:hypothetical protein
MATIMAGGARRSAAPTYQATNPRQALALNEDPDLLRRQIFEQPLAAAPSKAGGLGSMSEAFGRGTNTLSGQGANASFGGTPGVNASTVGRVGAGLSALGSLTGNADAAQLGGMLGLGGALGSAKSPTQALGVMAGPVASMMGVPAGAIGVGMGLMEGSISKTINSALSLANPALAAANALSNVLGIGTVGGAVAKGVQNYSLGANVDPSLGMVGAYQVGSAINADPDPIGALISAKSPAASGSSSGTSFGGGYGVQGGSLGNLSYGNRNTGSGGRGFGGYGGGIGQSGGNASGMGSSQA